MPGIDPYYFGDDMVGTIMLFAFFSTTALWVCVKITLTREDKKQPFL